MFSSEVRRLTDKYIPTKFITTHAQCPWYNPSIKRLSNKKKRLYRAAKLSQTNAKWAAYKEASDSYVTALKNAKENFMSNVLPSMLKSNVKQFWRTINPTSNDSISLLDMYGDYISESECAGVLNETFVNNFSHKSNSSLPHLPYCNYVQMPPVNMDAPGIAALISNLKFHSSPGYDSVDAKFLKNTSATSSIILAKIFQQSLDQSTLPLQWKIGKVVPIYKSGNKCSPTNYRPISLTSTCCKLLEHVLFTNLVNFLQSNSFFTPAQHGFRKTYSCETQLITFTEKLHTILDSSSQADCIYLDFSKAFDKVCHQLLLHKLSNLNLDRNVLQWIESFLTRRTQFVHANGFNSSFSEVRSGVPQGSVLGPLLFLIYINDLPSKLCSNIHLFADDCVIFRKINNSDDIRILQSDLTAVSNWCQTWLMELNINKCKVMHVSRNPKHQSTYYLNNIALELVTSYKYLGVHITTNLSWSTHIEHIINNANSMLGYLRRNFSRAPSSLKLSLYKSLIRPKLEYAASVWDPSQENLIASLELVQNNSARFILSNYNRTASISSMKSSLSLPSLSSRRKLFRLTMLHKIYYHSFLRNELLPQPLYISHRIDHRHKVGINYYHTKSATQSFLPRSSREWNHLPAEIAGITDNQLFRAALANIVYAEISDV